MLDILPLLPVSIGDDYTYKHNQIQNQPNWSGMHTHMRNLTPASLGIFTSIKTK